MVRRGIHQAKEEESEEEEEDIHAIRQVKEAEKKLFS